MPEFINGLVYIFRLNDPQAVVKAREIYGHPITDGYTQRTNVLWGYRMCRLRCNKRYRKASALLLNLQLNRFNKSIS